MLCVLCTCAVRPLVRRLQASPAVSDAERASLGITVPDRGPLEKRVCECYAVVKKEYDRLLPKSATD